MLMWNHMHGTRGEFMTLVEHHPTTMEVKLEPLLVLKPGGFTPAPPVSTGGQLE